MDGRESAGRMRAVVVEELGTAGKSGLATVAIPEPGPGEALIEIRAAPVNYVDALTLSGRYQFSPELPYTPGKGPAGVVRGVGAGVHGLQAGDRVLAMAEYGGYAEMVAVGHQQVYRIPDAMPFVDAAAMSLAFDTAWMALRERARIKPGESVLVLGATGAVGNAAVQLAKAMGARTVLASASSPDRSAELERFGADAIIDLSVPDLRQSIRDQVFAVTNGSGVDIVIDPLGADAFDGAIRALAWQGRLVVVGFAAGRIPALAANYLLLKNIEISGLQISDYRKRRPELMAGCYREIFRFYSEGLVRAPPSTTLPLEDWKPALEAVSGRKAPGRVILVP